MKKKLFSKILSTACAIATMTLCFSKVQAVPIDNTASIDSTKSYIIYSGSTKNALYDDNGVNEGWIRQGNYLDFDKSFSWKIEKNAEGFYLKNEGTNYYVKGNGKFHICDNVVSDKNGGSAKGIYLFEKAEDGYKLKSNTNHKYLTFGENRNYVTFTDDSSKASIWKIEEVRDDAVDNYIIYSKDKNSTLYDSGGAQVGWLQKGKYEYNNKFLWNIQKNGNEAYLKNVGTTWYVKGNGHSYDNLSYVVSDKNGGAEKGTYLLEKVLHGFRIKSTANNQYLTYGLDENYVTFTSSAPEATVWTIEYEPAYPKPEGSITLWENPVGTNYYRIPAITTTNDGTLLAINDLRYNHAGDLGNHRIDLLLKSSTDNGENWSNEINLTKDYSNAGYGFGDAAIVADRESDKVLILAATGSKGYWHDNPNYVSTRNNPIRVSSFVSTDGGANFSRPNDLTEQIYNFDSSWSRLFVTSGRIMQSRYIKVKDYYRIYAAILVSGKGNFVIYSDNFGESWNILGGTTSPIPNGDEAKVEELANGNVVLASRTGSGRFINVFKYNNDGNYTSGSWESKQKSLVLGKGKATNGETYIVYAKDTETNKYTYVALQSIPTLNNLRQGVGIFFKEVKSSESTATEYVNGWSASNFYMVQPLASAYSTFSVQKDGKIAFFYEDRNRGGYDAQFISLDLKTITNGKYEMAFKGIGSVETPYIIETQEQLEAVNGIFSKEKVNWINNIEQKNN